MTEFRHIPNEPLSSKRHDDTTALPRQALFWTENYQVGGCDRFLADLVHGAHKLGWDCTIAGNPNPAMDHYLISQGIRTPRAIVPIRSNHQVANAIKSRLRVPAATPQPLVDTFSGAERRAEFKVNARRNLVRIGDGLVRSLTTPLNYRALRNLLHEMRPSVVVINNGGYPGGESCRTMAIAAHRAGVPRIIHVVHNIPLPLAWPESAEAAYDRRLSEVTSAWVTASDFTSRALSETRGIPSGMIHTIHHGLAPQPPTSADEKTAARAELSIDDEAFVISIISLFDTRKGHETLINALNMIKARTDISRWKVLLVGDGETRSRIEGLVDRASLSQTVKFLGWRDEIGPILMASDVLALPSLSGECLPYAVFHAMEYGLPVIASCIAGIPEQVMDGETGILVTPGSEVELASALVALQDSDLRVLMGENGRTRLIDRFDPSHMVHQMTDLWTDPRTHKLE